MYENFHDGTDGDHASRTDISDDCAAEDTDDKTAKSSRVAVDTVKLTGTVKAVDLDRKTATVEGSGGRVVTVDAKNARNLHQEKVGDKVTLTYTREIAVTVRKSDQPPSVSDTQTVQVAPKGQNQAEWRSGP